MSHDGLAHIELPTLDLAALQRFFASIVGWRFEAVPGVDGYALFRTPDSQGDRLMSGPQAESPSATGPILHFAADDIDAALAATVADGGETLVPKAGISDVFGSYALLLGNVSNPLRLCSAR